MLLLSQVNMFFDYIILFFYFIFFIFIIKKCDFFNIKGINKKYIFIAFLSKVFLSFLLVLIYTYYYTDRSSADIYKYYDDSKIIFNALLNKPIDFFRLIFGFGDEQYLKENYYSLMNHWYKPFEDNVYNDSRFLIKLNAIFSVLSMGGNIYIHSLFMSFISFLSFIFLYKGIVVFFKNKEKFLFFVIFFIPTVAFWSSGLLKETLLFFFLFLFIYLYFDFFNKKQSILKILIFVLSFIMLFFLKVYVLFALIPALFAFALISYFRIKKKIFFLYAFTTIVYFFFVYFISNIFHNNILTLLSNKNVNFHNLANALAAGSTVYLPILNDNFFSLLRTLPYAWLNVFFRPLPNDLHSFLVVPDFVQNIVLFCVITMLFFKKEKNLTFEQKNFILMSLFFVFILYSIIGLTTPILGAIVRYKIPGLLFISISILTALDIKNLHFQISCCFKHACM